MSRSTSTVMIIYKSMNFEKCVFNSSLHCLKVPIIQRFDLDLMGLSWIGLGWGI